jgi:hypothetical protein
LGWANLIVAFGVWQELCDGLQHGRVRSRVRPIECGRCSCWPQCSSRNGSQSKAGHLECDDPNGFSRSPERPHLHYVVMPSPIGGSPIWLLLCGEQQFRLPVSLAASHDRPRHPCDLVGQDNRSSHLGRAASHQPSEPRTPLRTVLLGIAADTRSHRRYRLPCLVMLPSLSLPPVVCCFGTSPIQHVLT